MWRPIFNKVRNEGLPLTDLELDLVLSFKEANQTKLERYDYQYWRNTPLISEEEHELLQLNVKFMEAILSKHEEILENDDLEENDGIEVLSPEDEAEIEKLLEEMLANVKVREKEPMRMAA